MLSITSLVPLVKNRISKYTHLTVIFNILEVLAIYIFLKTSGKNTAADQIIENASNC
jgi:hypothetical protein